MEHSKTDSFICFAEVIVDTFINKVLDYGIPEELIPLVQKGACVEVTVNGRKRAGLVIAIKNESPVHNVIAIKRILGNGLRLSQDLISLILWMSDHYSCPLGQILRHVLPSGLRLDVSSKKSAQIFPRLTKDNLLHHAEALSKTFPKQAKVLSILIDSNDGIFLKDLLKKEGTSKSTINTLIKKNLIFLEKQNYEHPIFLNARFFKTTSKKLTNEQAAAHKKIIASLHSNTFMTHLLFGVTGSGKTEIYLQAVQEALLLGKSAIILVPEISLTFQIVREFKARFDNKIALLHHRLSAGERRQTWEDASSGKIKIIIGARSALFCPAQNLGLIIVDEEHDSAYKQHEEAPCYHARNLAVMRGKICNATVILGSATPSIESYTNALEKKYQLSSLATKTSGHAIENLTIIDMTKEREQSGNKYALFSRQLLDGIQKRLQKGEQSLLLLNRRGYHTNLSCTDCLYVFKCPHCDVTMTFHRGEKILACHLCDYKQHPPPEICPQCHKTTALVYQGTGTEKVEALLHAIFPAIRTLRIDTDTTRLKGSYEELFSKFSTGKADVLIGTQMIAKGLHFPSVTLVGILNGDAGLHIPDFRSSEHVFQLITQVSGRAGRGIIKGEVIIQTHLPDHPVIKLAAMQNYEKFYEEEVAIRKSFGYPPFSRLLKIIFIGKNILETQQEGFRFRQSLIEAASCTKMIIHPLVPSGHYKIKDAFRFQLLIRTKNLTELNKILKIAHKKTSLSSKVKMIIDVEPIITFF
ncbi:Primosomal protein N' [Candidatus Clavichlamydia salmonicola]|uniref:replication restart helicase PriA n=1 Tax=Candidatus Clavichlamydia salmonicola TaxID=469812 RepID=UPI001891BBA0|nr:primosomal protein N' [Candidatus Clavichlamydia salmonicola]MBF5050480.1 Primosomal protein N' [Candidatus Clavichlamydia salmonicola]